MTGAVVYCCGTCGRWGVRGFREGDNGSEVRVCVNDRACRRRTERARA